MQQAPSAQEFFDAEKKNRAAIDHEGYMDFAERYGDFLVEFEKKGGDIRAVTLWPWNRPHRIFGP